MPSDAHDQVHLSVISPDGVEQEVPPEAYLISALIQSGSYNPEAHGITSEHFLAYRQVHEFLHAYQLQAKAAPPLRLLVDKYPRFPFVPGVSAVWAATQLQRVHQERHLLRTMAKVGTLLTEGRVEAAGDLMRKASKASASSSSLTAVNAYQPIPVASDSSLKVPVMSGTMSEYCSGIAPGHLWYVAGIPGMGKTFRLLEHTVLAVEAGWNVAFFSLEMPAAEVSERLQRMLLAGVNYEYGTPEFYDLLAARTAEYGALDIYTGSTSTDDIASVAVDNTLIVIDYVGKIRASDGARSITDYRLAAAISGELKDIALTDVPMLSAVQFNRSAYDAKNVHMGHTADTDAYNKDADVMIGMKRMSETVILNTIMKNRHDVSGRKFYTRFTPGAARAVELSFDEANEAMYEDAERSITH